MDGAEAFGVSPRARTLRFPRRQLEVLVGVIEQAIGVVQFQLIPGDWTVSDLEACSPLRATPVRSDAMEALYRVQGVGDGQFLFIADGDGTRVLATLSREPRSDDELVLLLLAEIRERHLGWDVFNPD
jgi:hypothetical protein